jgi:hypothetical protein
MGGVEVVAAGGDGWKGDDVYQLLMQAALIRGGAAATWAANISTAGDASLAARYVSFGAIVIELLDYHSTEAQLQRRLAAAGGGGDATADDDETFPRFSPSNVAPSVAGNMHISFNVRPERDLNEFVLALEGQAHRLGYAEVLCNRVVPVPVAPDGRADVSHVPLADGSYTVEEGAFEGWSLAYCKGPDGEQLEMNKVNGHARGDFDQALRQYVGGASNPLW